MRTAGKQEGTLRRHSRPLTETRARHYRVVHTTKREMSQWAEEDRAKAIQALEAAAKRGPLSPAQVAQLARLLGANE